jgi:uncharacterized protein YdiU (UPF0061 family)
MPGISSAASFRDLVTGAPSCWAGRQAAIQLKGSRRTPFLRDGNGPAALGPVLREYIISEAMGGWRADHPALGAVTTGQVRCATRSRGACAINLLRHLTSAAPGIEGRPSGSAV